MVNNGSGYGAASKMMVPIPMPWFGHRIAMRGISGGLKTPLFTANGTPIRKPEAYIEGIKKKQLVQKTNLTNALRRAKSERLKPKRSA